MLTRSLALVGLAVTLAHVSPASAQRAHVPSSLGGRTVAERPAATRAVARADALDLGRLRVQPPDTTSADAPAHRVGSVWKHAGVGFLIGAGVGAAVGIAEDSSHEVTFPTTVVTLPIGALTGAVIGSLVWAGRRAHDRP